MAKVLGFTNNYGEDWFDSSPYGTKEIQEIPDPEGGHALNALTSIPSPFARMDLVRKSFQNIGESPGLGFFQRAEKVVASKEDEKTVSQCFDIAELLFFYDNYKDKLEILAWNKEEQLNKLTESTNSGHQKLGDVLRMYLRQDAKSFNFELMSNIYIIKYNHKVIGGTSPLTLFFNTANDGADLKLVSTKGKVFFKDIVPLYERDEDFQKYIYLLFKSESLLADKMKAVKEYLNKNLEILSKVKPALFTALNSLKISDLNTNYSNLYTRDAGQIVEVFGVGFKTIDASKIPVDESFFVIHSSKYNQGNKPLVLQNNFNKPYKYVNGTWDPRTPVKYLDTESLNQRTLPGLNIKYPYLSYSDFLEENLIRLVYPIDAERYFNGNLKLANEDHTKSYLLPIKPLFFEFFDVADLLDGGIGKPQISIEEGLQDSVRVLLKIPIKNGEDFIILERIYYNESPADPKNNKGGMVEQQVGLTVFPFIKHDQGIDPFYNIQLVDRNIVGNSFDIDYQLSFYSDANKSPLNIDSEKYRGKKIKGNFAKVTTKYYALNVAFDYIQVDSKFGKGMIIPKWKTNQNTGDQFTFAVDFGTTNTHVEYSVNNSGSKPFEITAEDVQAVSLFTEDIEHNFSGTNALDLRNSISKEFIPKIVKRDTTFNFPLRTALSQSKMNAPGNGGKALSEFNIPFAFEKALDDNSKFFTNLKWDSKEPNNEFRVKAFLEQIVLMIRSKVLMNGGNLPATKIVWTYPISMSSARKDNLSKEWNDLFKKYINKTEETISLSESLAPYYYFKSNKSLEGLGYGTSVLMDIGGGTSDVVVYKDNVPKLISSYKFAGNTVFGDGFSEFGNIQTNRMVQKYKGDFDVLLDNENSSLKIISDHIYANQKTSDYHAFLFSLANNFEIKNKELLDFNKKLALDDDLKIVFLYFYAAKIYHIAKLMKSSNLDLPGNLIFSGNGSKILNVISTNNKTLSDFTKAIFSFVYEQPSYLGNNLKISLEADIPKAITSKGSIVHVLTGDAELDTIAIRRTLTCIESQGMTQITQLDAADDGIQDKIVGEVQQFNEYFSKLLDDFDCEDKFGITYQSMRVFKEIANKHLKQFLLAGIAFNNSLEGGSIRETAVITDTLFFVPMVETIQQLIKELAVVEAEL